MVRKVNTVCDPVDSDKLGGILCHEHIIWGYPGYQGMTVSKYKFDRNVFFPRWKAITDKLKTYGIETIVECTPNDCGRAPEIMKAFSEYAEFNIIIVSGYYIESLGAPAFFKFRKNQYDCVSDIEELMHEEYYNGIGDTGIKVGALKVSCSAGEINEYDMMFHEAASRVASRDKDVRIITHTSAGTCGPEQAKYFIEHGVDPRQIAIGHCDMSTDMDYLMNIAETGVYMNFDRFSIMSGGAPQDSRRIACVAGMIAAGYGDKICISHDAGLAFFGRPEEFPPDGNDLLWIDERIVPAMKKAGYSDEQIHKLRFENPQAFYGAF